MKDDDAIQTKFGFSLGIFFANYENLERYPSRRFFVQHNVKDFRISVLKSFDIINNTVIYDVEKEAYYEILSDALAALYKAYIKK